MKNNLKSQPPTQKRTRPRPGHRVPIVAAEVTRLIPTSNRIALPKRATPSPYQSRGCGIRRPIPHQTENQTTVIPYQTQNHVKNAHFPSGTHRNQPKIFAHDLAASRTIPHAAFLPGKTAKTGENKPKQGGTNQRSPQSETTPVAAGSEHGSVDRLPSPLSNIHILRRFSPFRRHPPYTRQYLEPIPDSLPF